MFSHFLQVYLLFITLDCENLEKNCIFIFVFQQLAISVKVGTQKIYTDEMNHW